MNISKKLLDAINEQINLEYASAYTYLSMAAFFEYETLNGFAKWMHKQAKEEIGHGMKFFDFLNDRGARVELAAIAKPESGFSTALDVFEKSLEHEREVTASIYKIYDLAHEERDYATVSFLKWFVDEQVEEEKTAADMVDRLKLADGKPEAILLLDNEAGKRGGD